VCSIAGELMPGIEVLAEDYIPLPSSSPINASHWLNRYASAPAPQWLLDQLEQLAALAASKPVDGDDAMRADELLCKQGVSTSPPILVQDGWPDQEDKKDAQPHQVRTMQKRAPDALSDASTDEEEDKSSEIEKDTSEIDEEVSRVAYAPSSVPASPQQDTQTRADVRQPVASTLDHALDLVRRGFRVFPLAPNSKQAVLKAWPIKASADPAQIKIWWEENPDYNIGVPTDNLAIVDADPRKCKPDELSAFADKYFTEENKSLTVKTQSGGRHVFYQLPHGLSLSSQNDAFMDGIDLKTGSGAYVVGVGSGIEGREYTWIKERPIIELPPALIECLQERKKYKTAEKSAGAGERLVEEDDEAIRLATEYVEQRAPEAIEGKGGDLTTFNVAAKLFDFGPSKATVLALMHRYNEIKCFPPWSADDLAKKVDSAERNRQNSIGGKHPSNSRGFEPVETPDKSHRERARRQPIMRRKTLIAAQSRRRHPPANR
jgi:hypothetical protein